MGSASEASWNSSVNQRHDISERSRTPIRLCQLTAAQILFCISIRLFFIRVVVRVPVLRYEQESAIVFAVYSTRMQRTIRILIILVIILVVGVYVRI